MLIPIGINGSRANSVQALRQLLLAVVCFFSALSARGENWPQFRGPTGLGYTEERDLPLTWNATTGENIAWRAPLPKSDNPWSSPIVWGDRVFVMCATNQPRILSWSEKAASPRPRAGARRGSPPPCSPPDEARSP